MQVIGGEMLRSVDPGQWNICFLRDSSQRHQSRRGPLPLTLRCKILSGHETPGGSLTPRWVTAPPHHSFELHREEDSWPFTWGDRSAPRGSSQTPQCLKWPLRHSCTPCVTPSVVCYAGGHHGCYFQKRLKHTRRPAIYTCCGHVMNLTPFCHLLPGIFHIAE